MRYLAALLVLVAWALPAALQAEDAPQPTPREVVERGVAAHGGAGWLDPGTLILSGEAVFYDPATGAVRSRADDYRMWRVFERGRTVAHGAEGKVRISARSGDSTIFEVGYDGETT